MQKKLLWKNRNNDLKLYATKLFELETPAMVIPFTDRSRIMMYLQQRYKIADQEYREVYNAITQYSDEHFADQMIEENTSTLSTEDYDEKAQKWAKQARENQEVAKNKIIEMAEKIYRDPEVLAEYLQFGSRFYQYSPKNVMLILTQNE